MIDFSTYFKFPVLMVDEMNEMRKGGETKKFGVMGNEEDPTELDIITAEAEVEASDKIISMTDKWVPDNESFIDAQEGKFNCCIVHFMYAGTFYVHLNKEIFKKKYLKFCASLPPEPEMVKIKLSNKQMAALGFKETKDDSTTE